MKDLISLLEKLIWPGLILIVIIIFSSQLKEFFGIIIKWADSGSSVSVGPFTLGEDLRDSDKVSEEEKDKAVAELAQKREKDYVYGDWNNAAVIAYIEKRYEAALHNLSQALQYAKTKEQEYAKTKEQVAEALFNQGFVLGQTGHSEEALQVSKQVDERYGKDTDPGVREEVAKALVNQGVVLRKLDHFEEALQVLKQMDARYGKDIDPGVREQVAKALFNQGVVLGKMGRFKEALQVYKQVNARYGKDTEPGVRESVAKALGNQGVVIGKMGRFEEAIVTLRKAEVIFSELGITEGEQEARKFIEQWKKKK